MAVVRWKIEKVHEVGPAPHEYTFAINPNEATSATVEKAINVASVAGRHRGAVLQEGRTSVPALSFSGVILTQAHLEALERWFIARFLLDLTDDLGRVYRGVFSSFNPQRPFRAGNFWYHTFDAQFQASAYRNASGDVVYGRFV